MSLSAVFDGSTLTRIIFNEPVTLDRAITFLWGARPSLLREVPDAFRPDPAEHSVGGAQRRFLIRADCAAHLIQTALPTNLQREYTRRGAQASGVPVAAGSVEQGIPDWVPEDLRNRILRHDFPEGPSRFRGRGPRPWGDVIIWQHRRGPFPELQIFLEFPSDLSFYRDIAGGDEGVARLIQSAYVLWNNDMAYFVEGPRRLSPSQAREELIRINDQLFREVVKQAVMVLGLVGALNAVVALMRANSQLVAHLADQREGLSTFGNVADDYNVAYAGGGPPREGGWRSGPRAGSGSPAEPFNRGSAGPTGRLPSDTIDEFGDTLIPPARQGIPVTRRSGAGLPNNQPPRPRTSSAPPESPFPPGVTNPQNIREPLSQADAFRRFQTLGGPYRAGSCYLGPNGYELYVAEWRAIGGRGPAPPFGFRIVSPDGLVVYNTAYIRDPSPMPW